MLVMETPNPVHLDSRHIYHTAAANRFRMGDISLYWCLVFDSNKILASKVSST
jgi:hypothetical protein